MNFLNRHFKRLEKTLEQWKDWGRMICASDDYGATLRPQEQARHADLVHIGASSVVGLFNVHARKADVDLRFGFDFIRRVYSNWAGAMFDRLLFDRLWLWM